MKDASALFAIGMPGEMPRQWAEGEPSFVAAQMKAGEVAQRLDASAEAPVAQPLPASSDI